MRAMLTTYLARFVLLLAFIVGAYLLCAHFLGCASAETRYTTELMRCVDKARTLPESKACRALTDAKWGVVQDAGAE